ncbi:MAG TPA: hypothetical protein VGN25_04570 [Solirubrobacteraceae bacterium]|nr:hypothetical protein [Solirubrobacteraceae bacterium]
MPGGLVMELELRVRLVPIGWLGLVAIRHGESHGSVVICLLGWTTRLDGIKLLDIGLIRWRLEGGEHIVGLGLLELGVRLVGRCGMRLRRLVFGIGLLRARKKRSFLRQLWYWQIAWKLRRLHNGAI